MSKIGLSQFINVSSKLCFCLLLLSINFSVSAAWTNVVGYVDPSGNFVCPTSASEIHNDLSSNTVFKNGCVVDIPRGNSVPNTGGYVMYLAAGDGTGSGSLFGNGASRTLDATKQLSDQSVDWGSYNAKASYNINHYHLCYELSGSSGWYTINGLASSCERNSPLPPGPNYLACTFNSGNALDVALGEVDRSAIGTTSGTTTKTEKSIDVTCTGDGTATYSVQFEYTPITAGSDELITTTANGLGVAMSFNDAPVKTTDKITRTYSTGTQTERLTFEPVRNPAVQASDIPTGAFTASAVMVLTEE